MSRSRIPEIDFVRPCNLCPHMKRITLPRSGRSPGTDAATRSPSPAAIADPRTPRGRTHAGVEELRPLRIGQSWAPAAVMIEPLGRGPRCSRIWAARGTSPATRSSPMISLARTALVVRQPGVVAGLDLVELCVCRYDPRIEMRRVVPDGAHVASGQVLATVSGPGGGILTAERTALNFLCHLSGVATGTASIVASIAGQKACVACTRKTMPGLRAVQKYAGRLVAAAIIASAWMTPCRSRTTTSPSPAASPPRSLALDPAPGTW